MLPPPYDAWLTEALGAPILGEPAATCADCAMCPRGADDPGKPFRPDVKCCGTWPAVPNFQAGAALRAGGEAAASIRRRLEVRGGVSPLGLRPPPDIAAALHATPFGADPALACPHFRAADGACAIWAHRDAVCATWFCRVGDGPWGQARWIALRQLLQSLEATLTRWAAAEAGAEPPRGFGRWGRDAEGLYRACDALVAALSWQDVRRLGGFDLRTRLRALREARRDAPVDALADGPLALATFREAHPLPGGGLRVRTWSPTDHVDLDELTAAALAAGRVEALDPAERRRLVRQGVLVASPPSARDSSSGSAA